jgi:cytidyltransferase-like protein
MKYEKAMFLGKFQPPHLGHIRTITNMANEYSKIIVGITKGSPKMLDYNEVKKIFDDIFQHNNNVDVEIIEGVVEDNTVKLEDFDFDIIVSGNNKVLELLKSKGYKTSFQQRTDGVGYSSSEIRALSSAHNIISIDKQNIDLKVELVAVSTLKPLELVLPMHFKNIEKMVLSDRVMIKPLIIDDKYNIVLDGSHRYAFLIKYGFKFAPVIKVDYADESIFVGNHLKHRYVKDVNFLITKSEVISRGVNENLFNARTTRHFFPFRKNAYPTSLNSLEKGREKEISYLLADITVADEMKEDFGYISEIDEELKVLESYIKEQKEVKEYLALQINEMKKSE